LGLLDNKNRLRVQELGVAFTSSAMRTPDLAGGETRGDRQRRDELWGPIIRQIGTQDHLPLDFLFPGANTARTLRNDTRLDGIRVL
jgi:hypothetical protein